MATVHASIDERGALTAGEFYREYVNQKPVVMRGALRQLPAVSRWSTAYLRALAPDLRVRLKTGSIAQGETTTQTLAEYCDLIKDTVARVSSGERLDEPPPYLHDIPLLTLIPALKNDLEPFPVNLFPKFFRDRWWSFTQFFVSPPQAATPFHFDTLGTHNLFFQVHGDKRFVIVPPEDRSLCYTYNWRWSRVDPDDPDFEKYPLFRGARTFECALQPGDILYMPPGTLHKVSSLTASISFNIDWHDRTSALNGMLAVRDGMPARNLQYNTAFMLGVFTDMPFRWLRPLLDSYYYYIS